jgi:hypothetical protein
LSSTRELREVRYNDSYMDWMYLTELSIRLFLAYLGEIQYRTSPLNDVEQLWVSCKLVQLQPYFMYGSKRNFTHTVEGWDAYWELKGHKSPDIDRIPWSILCIFRLPWIGLCTGDVHTTVLSDGTSRDSRRSEKRRNCISVLTFHVYCPVWVKIDVREQHIIPWRIYEFRENRLREDFTFLKGANETIFTRVPWRRMIFWK